jgi:peptidyl-prolyl cis-trans isomerase A (cyclophilin A)
MSKFRKTWTLIFLIIFFLDSYAQETIIYTIETSLGEIEVELFPEKAPATVFNFTQYADKHLYDSSSFFRVCTKENEASRKIKIEVIQGGDVPTDKLYPPIPLETTKQTNIRHENRTISMARGAPNSAQSSFFICINDQPELDFGGKRNPDGQGFAAFGKVIKGMDTVKKIQAQKNKDHYLTEPVVIYTVRRMDKDPF